jgi:Transcription elongation factor
MNKEEFIKAVDFVAKEKGISKDIIFEAMELALLTAYKKNFDSKTNARVDINRETGEIKVYKVLTVVDSIDEEDPEAYAKILESDADKIVKGIKVGETIEEEITPKDFGRVATSTAKQVMTQKLREAERESIMSEFEGKQDELLVGQVSREDGLNYYIDLGRAHGILPKKELIPGEKIEMGSSIKVYVTKIEDSKGPLILLSRNHFGFVKRLLEHEVPEFADGTVKLYSVARDAGSRVKLLLF